MVYAILADAVVFVHFLWILFLIFGAFAGVRNRVVKVVHIAGMAFAAVIEVFGWYCPLTDLEVWLRFHQAPGLAYRGSFIIHYVEKIVYLGVPRGAVAVATAALCFFNAWIYLKKKRRADETDQSR